MSNSGTNSISLDSRVDVDRDSRGLVLEAINAIEVVEAREVIEHAIVRLAAQRRSDADLARLESLLSGMRSSLDDATSLAQHDVALHLALCDAARNTLLAAGLGPLRGRIEDLIRGTAAAAVAERRGGALLDSRTQLVAAIRKRDVERASIVFSRIMHDLRVEAGRACVGPSDHARPHPMAPVGMLDGRPQPKGDRP